MRNALPLLGSIMPKMGMNVRMRPMQLMPAMPTTVRMRPMHLMPGEEREDEVDDGDARDAGGPGAVRKRPQPSRLRSESLRLPGAAAILRRNLQTS